MTQKNRSLSFGLERVAMALVARPRLAVGLVALLVIVAAFGATRLSFDEDLRNVFRSDDAAYRTYVETTGRFTDPENELIVLFEGAALGTPAVFSRLRDFQFELQLRDDVGSVFSLFSLRRPPAGDGDPPLLVDDPASGLTPELAAAIRAHPILGQKLLSADASSMLMVVTPSQARAPLGVQRALGEKVEALAARMFAGMPLTATLTGFPIIRSGIVERLVRDQKILTVVGALIGLVLSFAFFRSATAAAMTAVPSLVAGLTVFGAMGLLGIKVSVMSIVVPVLVMILGYADGMHLSYAFREARAHGDSAAAAEMKALADVGSAGLLTSLTTAVAFLSLVFSDIDLVTNFAWIGAFGVFFGAFVVMICHGLMGRLIGHRWRTHLKAMDSFLGRLSRPSAAIAGFGARHAWRVSAAALALLLTFGAMHLSLVPQHSVRENLPPHDPANAALERIDEKFAGTFPIFVLIPPAGAPATAPAGLQRIAAIHRAVGEIPGVSRPLSLWSLAEWLGGTDDAERSARTVALLDKLKPEELRRFLSADGYALLSVNIAERPSDEMRRLIERIDAAARAAGGPGVAVTGGTAVNARAATKTINNLSNALVGSVGADLLLIGLAFGSWRLSAIAFLPNILPIVATGAMIYLLGLGLQFTSVIALTISFGIAVDDTIHYLNRFRLSAAEAGMVVERLVRTSTHIGPVMIATTLIIFTGLSTTLVSELPTIALFGEITAATLATALLCDLLFLPAILAGPAKRWFEKR